MPFGERRAVPERDWSEVLLGQLAAISANMVFSHGDHVPALSAQMHWNTHDLPAPTSPYPINVFDRQRLLFLSIAVRYHDAPFARIAPSKSRKSSVRHAAFYPVAKDCGRRLPPRICFVEEYPHEIMFALTLFEIIARQQL